MRSAEVFGCGFRTPFKRFDRGRIAANVRTCFKQIAKYVTPADPKLTRNNFAFGILRVIKIISELGMSSWGSMMFGCTMNGTFMGLGCRNVCALLNYGLRTTSTTEPSLIPVFVLNAHFVHVSSDDDFDLGGKTWLSPPLLRFADLLRSIAPSSASLASPPSSSSG
ncbi:hypothetical protein KC363_g223 [Hortaea werneckii]|nr:hypothetical protein KC363_g223 [Hortaea werneckii]